MSEAMIAQQKARLESPDGKDDSAAYDYGAAIKEGKKFREMNPEQQAHLIDEAYKAGYFDSGKWVTPKNPNDPNSQPTPRPDLDNYMQQFQITEHLRKGEGAP